MEKIISFGDLTQSRFDAIGLSRAQVTKTKNNPATTPICSKRNRNPEINGEGTMLEKTPKSDLKEPTQSPIIHMIQERGKKKAKLCFWKKIIFGYYSCDSNDDHNIYL